jgi:predicted permease
MRTIFRDASRGVRLIRRQPGVSAIAMATLALGIGGTAVAFGVIDAAILRPLPYPHPEQLVGVRIDSRWQFDKTVRALTPSIEDLERLRDATTVVSHIAWSGGAGSWIIEGSSPTRVSSFRTREVTDAYFAMLGIRPAHGRLFTRADLVPGAPAVVILGHGFWQRRFGADPGAIGQVLPLRGQPSTVVGVLPAGFFDRHEPNDEDLWFPVRRTGQDPATRGQGTMHARLKPGVSLWDAERQLTFLMGGSMLLGDAPTEHRIRLESLEERTARDGVNHATVNGLVGAIGLVFLLACINVAGLLLARGATRQAEMAVRRSLGASRARLTRQLLTETFVLWIVGGVCGLLVASAGMQLVIAHLSQIVLPANSYPSLNLRVLAATAAFSAVAALVVGVLPASKLSRVRVATTIGSGDGGRSALSRRGSQLLIAAEITLTVLLLTSAALMARSFVRLNSVAPGLDTTAIVLDVSPVDDAPEHLRAYYPVLMDAIRRLPGVEAVGAGIGLIFDAGQFGFVAAMGPGASDSPIASVRPRTIQPGFFEALGIPVLHGRLPHTSDLSGVSGVWLNESLARLAFPDGPAVGRFVEVARAMREVIGIVADVNYTAPYGAPEPEVYLPSARLFESSPTLVVRARRPSAAMLEHLREAVRAAGPPVVIDRVQFVGDAIRSSEPIVLGAQWSGLFGVFGIVGSLLGLVGVFGTTAYAVARRTREIGVRVALGARPDDVVRLMLRDAVVPIAAGIGAGLFAATLAGSLVESLLFNTTPTDPGSLAAVALAVGTTGALAAWVPARRATRVDPIRALRAE